MDNELMLNFFFKVLFFFTLLISTRPLFANEYIQACFKVSKNANFALKKIHFLKVASDRIRVDGKCIDIYTKEKRKNLFLKYLRANFQGYYKLTSQEVYQARTCNLQLIKSKRSILTHNKLNLNTRININQANNNSTQSSITTIKIQNNNKSTIRVNNQSTIKLNNQMIIQDNIEELSIHCTIRTKGYDLKISSLGLEDSIVSTTFLPFGQTYQLGKILTNIDDKKTSLGISTGVNYNKQKSNSNASFTIKALNEL
jgi:hypothetical protein